MKQTVRITGLLLALALLLSLLPTAVFAEGELTGSCGSSLTWSFDEQTGALTILGSGDMDDFGWSGNPDWQSFRRQVKSIILPDGLTSIGDNAFTRFLVTDTLVLPQSVTRIGQAAFNDCDLSAVTIPDGVKVIEYGAFNSCDNFTELHIPAGITELAEEVFGSCSGLTSVEIPDNIRTIGDKAFQGCTGLKSVTIPDSVTVIGDNAFARTGLETVSIGAKVTSIGTLVFAYCPALTAINVDPANPGYASEDGVFYNKSKSTLIQCPRAKTGDFTVPATVTVIHKAAFEGCAGLTSMTVAGQIADVPDDCFRDCAGLAEVTLPGSLQTIGWSAFYGCASLEQIRIPEGVEVISSGAFDECTSLKAVKLLSKTCEIAESDDTLGVPGFTILFGHKGSSVEDYAKTYGYTFKELSQEDDPCALGHDFGEWTQTKDPTCEEAGALTRVCSRCQLVDYETIPALGHDWDEGMVTVAPTQTTAGECTYTCRRCKATKTERIRPTGSTLPENIDFTDPGDADKYEIAGQSQSSVEQGVGLALVATQGGVEPAKQDIAEADHDVVKVSVSYDWTATLEVEFDGSGAQNGYYQFFAFFASEGGDNRNMLGIRGGDGAMQNFERHDGTITHEDEDGVNSTPGFSTNGVYYLRIEKSGTTYVCSRSADGAEFTEMFTYEDSGIEADQLIIDAYTGMTEGYKFTLKSLTFTGGVELPPEADKTVLIQVISQYEFITTPNYTPESVEAFQSAIAAGRQVRDDENATQDEVDAAAQAILDAYNALTPLPPAFRFDDVQNEDSYYYMPVYWAFNAEPQITKGTTDTLFGPDDPCTRGQVVTFLWRAAGEPAPNGTNNPFTDVSEKKFYYIAVLWAVENGITNGMTENTFAPDSTCNRGQIVTFLWRFRQSPAPKDVQNPFTDVAPSTFYYTAVLWAVENGVTKGMTDTTFEPGTTCTRGQVVTFLYRATAD